MQLGMK